MNKFAIAGKSPDNNLHLVSRIMRTTLFLLFVNILVLQATNNPSLGNVIVTSLEPSSFEIRDLEENGMIVSEQMMQQIRTIRGKVTDKDGEPLPGVTIIILGTSKGVITDNDGSYTIEVQPTDKLVFSFVGMENQIIEIGSKTTINVELFEKVDELDEVTIVGFSKQKKESVISSITTINPSELKVPSSNLTTALAGKVAGMISYQRSGEPGEDDASFFVRGVTSFSYARGPLILIDGMEMSSGDLARLQPDDIKSFSIMKDAAASAQYGARGANGVILVTTKDGSEGKAKINFRYETSVSSPTTNVELADPITYMHLNNEAVLTRNPLTTSPYTQSYIDNVERGTNPYVYPATDWYNTLFKKSAVNHRANFNVSGGGNIARYYIAGTYNQDYGALKVDKRNNFNNNIDLKRYLLRSNVSINVTPTTEAVVRLYGTFDDYTGPTWGGSGLYQRVMRTDPVLFPPYYPQTNETEHVKHIMFGNFGQGNYINPYADLTHGYKDYTKSKMMGQFELRQDLDFITEGLELRGMFNTDRYSYYDVYRFYNAFYYTVGSYDKYKNTYQLSPLNPNEGTHYLDYRENGKQVTSTTYFELATNYDRTFAEKHSVSGLLVGTMRNYLEANAGSLIMSLPFRNMGLSGRLAYAYDNRYFSEFNFGYNGSERFAKQFRFGFFPSGGLAWYVSNEPYYGTKLKKVVTKLKLKGTYGMVGNDAIGSATDRFFYLSEVNMNNSGRGYSFGDEFAYGLNGISISRYANDQITWETATKLNVGLEVGLIDKFDIMLDLYHEYRTDILMSRASIPPSMGLQVTPQANVGEASGSGFDFSVDYNQAFINGIWLTGRANFTYATSQYEVYEDVDNSNTPWLDRVGQPISQQWGYLAERLFVDDQEVENSPAQIFGDDIRGGDIKYRDINNDGVISSLDRVPIGYPTTPEIIYGFGLSTGYKGVDFSFFFQGLANESFWINAEQTSPFIDTDGDNNIISKNALLQVYAENHWTEQNRDIYALWPRLSDRLISNNTQRSTWFMRDGSFLRLKSVEFGYSLPKKWVEPIKITNLRFYASGTNLLTFSKFKLWDPEMAGNGLGYPIQRVWNIGLQLSF